MRENGQLPYAIVCRSSCCQKKKTAVNTEGDAASENQTAAASSETLACHKSASSTADLPPEVSSEPALAQIPSAEFC